jgi:hypothetical protein
MNRAAVLGLPKSAPTSFVRERWAGHVLPGGDIDRRLSLPKIPYGLARMQRWATFALG